MSTPDTELSPVLVDRCDGVATITLNRPRRLNAIDAEMRDQIRRAFADASAAEDVGAVVLTGAGDRAFTAGQDVRELLAFDADGAEEWVRDLGRLYNAIRECRKPVIVALNGISVGAGLQMALHADLRIGYPEIRLSQGEIDVGIPSILGPWVMRDVMGIGPTTDMSLRARQIDAEEALKFGILHAVVPQADVMATALEWANELAAKPRHALAVSTLWLRELPGKSFPDTVDAGVAIMREAFASGEPQAEIRRFLDKAKR